MSRQHLEDREAMWLHEWSAFTRTPYGMLNNFLIHIPNGGTRSPREAKRLKQMGVLAGVSDYFLAIPAQHYHGLWLELKKPRAAFGGAYELGRAVSAAQLVWGDRVQQLGYAFSVTFGFEEARKAILSYLKVAPFKEINTLQHAILPVSIHGTPPSDPICPPNSP